MTDNQIQMDSTVVATKSPLFELKYSESLEQMLVTKLRNIDSSDMFITHFSHDNYSIIAHYKFSDELLAVREWDLLEELWGAKPLKNSLQDTCPVRHIKVDYRGCWKPETIARKKQETIDRLIAKCEQESEKILDQEIMRIQMKIDHYIERANGTAIGRVDNWLSSKESFETIKNSSVISNLENEYESLKQLMDEAHDRLIREMNNLALKESAEVLDQLPDSIKTLFVERLKSNHYFNKNKFSFKR